MYGSGHYSRPPLHGGAMTPQRTPGYMGFDTRHMTLPAGFKIYDRHAKKKKKGGAADLSLWANLAKSASQTPNSLAREPELNINPDGKSTPLPPSVSDEADDQDVKQQGEGPGPVGGGGRYGKGANPYGMYGQPRGNPYRKGRGMDTHPAVVKIGKHLNKHKRKLLKRWGLTQRGSGMQGSGGKAFLSIAKSFGKDVRSAAKNAARHIVDELSDKLGGEMSEDEAEDEEARVAQEIMEDPEIRSLATQSGGNFWKKVKKGAKKLGHQAIKGVKSAANYIKNNPGKVLEFLEENPELLLLAA